MHYVLKMYSETKKGEPFDSPLVEMKGFEPQTRCANRTALHLDF